MRTMLLLAATLGAVAVTYAATSAAAPNAWTTEHYLTKETWHAFADVGKRDNGGADDIYAARQDLKTTDGQSVGVVNGYGINLHQPYVFFHWTATLRGGTLTLESAVDLKQSSSVYPIEGGTGRYAGARGTATLADAGSKGTLVTVRYRR
jgi:hypothetical protein